MLSVFRVEYSRGLACIYFQHNILTKCSIRSSVTEYWNYFFYFFIFFRKVIFFGVMIWPSVSIIPQWFPTKATSFTSKRFTLPLANKPTADYGITLIIMLLKCRWIKIMFNWNQSLTKLPFLRNTASWRKRKKGLKDDDWLVGSEEFLLDFTSLH